MKFTSTTLCFLLALMALASVFHSMDMHRQHEQTMHEIKELRRWIEQRSEFVNGCHVQGNGTSAHPFHLDTEGPQP